MSIPKQTREREVTIDDLIRWFERRHDRLIANPDPGAAVDRRICREFIQKLRELKQTDDSKG